jgi:glycine/D-amino acid oxidase-like deaminating enzyme
MTAAIAPPVWAPTDHFEQPTPLEGDSETDVTVIGAGVVGLVAALELAEAGRRVAIVEAGAIGGGASGAAAGQVGPLFYGNRKTPADVTRHLGAERAARLHRLIAGSGRWLFTRVAQLGVDCAARQGLVGVYRSEKSLARAAAIFAQWEGFGGAWTRFGRNEVPSHIGSQRYAGGIHFPDGGFIDPVLLLQGLVTAARNAGIRIHAHSRVRSLARDGRWTVRTDHGHLDSEQVLVATGAARFEGSPELARSVYAVPCGIAATAPLADRGLSLLPMQGPVVDLDDKAVFAPAVTADGRLLVSFLLRGAPRSIGEAAAPARRRLERAFPGQALAPFETLSWGRIALTPDGLPRLLRGPDGIIAITGCNGFGLTLGVSAAREAARLLLGAAPDSLALPFGPPRPAPAARLVPALFGRVIVPLANRFGA